MKLPRMRMSSLKMILSLALLLLLSSTVMATDLFITVQDSLDNSPIPNAAIYKNGSNMGRTTSSGTFVLMNSGEDDFELKIIKRGYAEWKSVIRSDATDLTIGLKSQGRLLAVELYDAETLIPITGATINLTLDSTTDTSTTNETGVATFAINPDSVYSITIDAIGYLVPEPHEVEIQSEGNAVQYWLVRNDRFSFIVTDDENNAVENATIFLNGELAGLTNSRGVLGFQVIRQTPLTIEVKKDGFQEYLESRTINEEDAVLPVVITRIESDQGNTVSEAGETVPGLAELVITVKDEYQNPVPDARLFLNDTDLGLSDGNGQVVTYINYSTVGKIAAQKEGYEATSAMTTVSPGNATSLVTLTLRKNPDWGAMPLIILGVIGILVLLGGAIVQRSRRRRKRHIIRRNEI
jgi:hypothetical protein